MEGIEYTRALGKVTPVAMTFGIYTPDDITMTVHKAYSAALVGLFAPLGNIFDIVSSIQAQLGTSRGQERAIQCALSPSVRTKTRTA